MKYIFKYLDHSTINHNIAFHTTGVGLHEQMPACIVNRPKGTDDWLMMLFYEPIQLRINNEIVNKPANTLMIWDHTMGHYYGNPQQPWRHSWLHFCGNICNRLVNETGIKCQPYSLSSSQSQIFEIYLKQMYHERVENKWPSTVIQQNIFHNLLLELQRSRSTTQQDIPLPIIKVKQYLECNFEKKITLKKLAKHAAISIPHLASEFKKYYQTSPIDYLIKTRITNAEYLLKDKNLTVREIAERLGYHDHFHFTKQFKKVNGLSPKKFRTL